MSYSLEWKTTLNMVHGRWFVQSLTCQNISIFPSFNQENYCVRCWHELKMEHLIKTHRGKILNDFQLLFFWCSAWLSITFWNKPFVPRLRVGLHQDPINANFISLPGQLPFQQMHIFIFTFEQCAAMSPCPIHTIKYNGE